MKANDFSNVVCMFHQKQVLNVLNKHTKDNRGTVYLELKLLEIVIFINNSSTVLPSAEITVNYFRPRTLTN